MITFDSHWEIVFYPKLDGDVEKLPPSLKARMIHFFDIMQRQGGNLGAPHTQPMGDGLFELRVKAKGGIARSLYCMQKGRRIIILCVFVKKQQKTPKRYLDLARQRMKEI